MKKADTITKVNDLITEHELDFDLVAEDTDMKVKDLNSLLSDVEDAADEATAPPSFKLADIAKAEGKDPKTVRARFRRMDNNEDEALPPTVEGASQRWTFLEEHREAVTALVVNDD